ncbi:MAG: ATP-binding protein [Halobacteriota archaeon]|nr:ATP-binding protein [Halobacteriota archaeon]
MMKQEISMQGFDVLDSAPVGMCVIDRDYKVIFWNSCLEDWTGINREDIIGTDLRERFPHLKDPKYHIRIDSIFEGGPPTIFSSQLHKQLFSSKLPNGEPMIQHTIITAVPAQDEDDFNALFAVQDVTELTHLVMESKRAERALAKLNEEITEKNKELETVIHVTSHDLRSPLVNVQGFSKELCYTMEELASILNDVEIPQDVWENLSPIFEEDIPDTLEFIQASVSKMDTLLTGLLRLSRLGRAALNFEDLDMNAMLSDIKKSFEFRVKEAGMSVVTGDLPPCIGDAVQINQVFSNLVDNALKYRDPEKHGIIKITGERKGGEVVYCVEDNGLGIPEKNQKDIFIIFRRLDPKSTEGEGLGLSIVSKILSRNNGGIRVESTEGEGSKFFVSLPFVRDKNKRGENSE